MRFRTLLAASIAASISTVILATRRDLADIEVVPGVQQARAPRTPWASAMEAPHAAGSEPAGLTLRARF